MKGYKEARVCLCDNDTITHSYYVHTSVQTVISSSTYKSIKEIPNLLKNPSMVSANLKSLLEEICGK